MEFSEEMYGEICNKEVVATLLIMLTQSAIAGAELQDFAKEKGCDQEVKERIEKKTNAMMKNGDFRKVTEMLIAEAFTLNKEFNK